MERALELPGPLTPSADVPGWLQRWADLRKKSDSTAARLRIVVDGQTCKDTSVFDPTMTHRLLFVRRFHGYPDQAINWLMAYPIGGDTNDGPALRSARSVICPSRGATAPWSSRTSSPLAPPTFVAC